MNTYENTLKHRATKSTTAKTFGVLTTDHQGNIILTKRIAFSTHLLHRSKAIAFSCEVLEDARNAGAQIIKVHDLDGRDDYAATMQTMDEKGFDIHYPPYEPQRALRLKHWTKNPKEQEAPLPTDLQRQLEVEAPLKVKQFTLLDRLEAANAA